MAAFIDITVGTVVIGGCLWAIAALFVTALVGGTRAVDEQVLAEYLREQHKLPTGTDTYDTEAREWMASQRRAS